NTDNTVALWDLNTSEKARILSGHGGPVWNVAFSPDGRHLASAGRGGPVKIWDLTTGQATLSLRAPIAGDPQGLAFSFDGQRVAAGTHNAVTVWDATHGHELLSLGHTGHVLSVAFSPDGRFLASAGM